MIMVSEGANELRENDELKGDELSGSNCTRDILVPNMTDKA